VIKEAKKEKIMIIIIITDDDESKKSMNFFVYISVQCVSEGCKVSLLKVATKLENICEMSWLFK